MMKDRAMWLLESMGKLQSRSLFPRRLQSFRLLLDGHIVSLLQLKELAQAYEVLSDPEKREIYGEYGEDALKEGLIDEEQGRYSQFSEDFLLSNPCDGGDSSLLTLSGDASSDLDHGCPNDNFSLTEQLELQFLSDELELGITDRAETPRLDVS